MKALIRGCLQPGPAGSPDPRDAAASGDVGGPTLTSCTSILEPVPQPLITVVPSKAEGRTVLRVQGDLDIESADLLATELRKVEESSEVVVDLRDVTFLDSSGLGVLVHCDLRLRATKRALALLIRDGQVRQLFELTGLFDQMTVVYSLTELARS
jgi:anti-sigma B factor antagonist